MSSSVRMLRSQPTSRPDIFRRPLEFLLRARWPTVFAERTRHEVEVETTRFVLSPAGEHGAPREITLNQLQDLAALAQGQDAELAQALTEVIDDDDESEPERAGSSAA
jgi:hypothetical protein